MSALASFILLQTAVAWTVKWSRTETNKISISWEDAPMTDTTYRVFRRAPSDSEWHTISTFNFETDDTIRVLNVYPVSTPERPIPQVRFKYSSSSGTETETETETREKSAALRVWLEGGSLTEGGVETHFEAAGRSSKTGRQLITVKSVSHVEFNARPSIIWEGFDVLMYGTWDGNGLTEGIAGEPNDLTSAAISEIRKFIKRGYGVLTGHDTITGTWESRGLAPLKTYFGIELGCSSSICEINDPGGWRYNSDKIRVVKKGFVTMFPWDLPTDEILTIPLTHTQRNCAGPNADMWIKLVDGNWNNGASGEMRPIQDSDEKHYFLATKNNTAMIQTGHSECRSNEYERRVLANALYYIKQRTTKKWMIDNDIFDVIPPSRPVCSLRDGRHDRIEVLCESHDVPELYRYFVESRESSSDSHSSVSDEIVVDGSSGFSHFKHWRDSSISSSPSGHVLSESSDSIFVSRSGSRYLHVFGVDRAGNEGQITTIDLGAAVVPSFTFSLFKDQANAYVPVTRMLRPCTISSLIVLIEAAFS